MFWAVATQIFLYVQPENFGEDVQLHILHVSVVLLTGGGWGCWVWGGDHNAVGFAARSVVCGLVCVTYGVQTINLVAFGHFDNAVFVS